ncbi:chitin deacetylase [Polyrhizophydium stewartii]|uniref:Chitin deacetylase n=1 Tax=Polyrhizophydium stewartii TaxID=2732419 RepID=A0ABR4NFR2_9FUNG
MRSPPTTLLLLLAAAAAAAVQVLAATPRPADYPKTYTLARPVAAWSQRFLRNIPPAGVGKTMARDETACKAPLTLGLSFDDGPSSGRASFLFGATPQLLAALAARGLHATFFVVGTQVIQHPDLLVQMHRAGHEIAIHTWSHPHLTNVSSEAVVAELFWTAKIINEVLGVTPKLFRPPYGDIDERVRTIARNMGLTVVDWNFDSGDALGATDVADRLKARLAQPAPRGIITLEHDLFPNAVAQAPAAIDAALAAGFRPVRISECIGQTKVYDSALLTSTGLVAPEFSLAPLPTATSSSATHSSTAGAVPLADASTTAAAAKKTGTVPVSGPPTTGDKGGAASLAASLAAVVVPVSLLVLAA